MCSLSPNIPSTTKYYKITTNLKKQYNKFIMVMKNSTKTCHRFLVNSLTHHKGDTKIHADHCFWSRTSTEITWTQSQRPPHKPLDKKERLTKRQLYWICLGTRALHEPPQISMQERGESVVNPWVLTQHILEVWHDKPWYLLKPLSL